MRIIILPKGSNTKKYFRRLFDVIKFLLMALISMLLCSGFAYAILKTGIMLGLIFAIVLILPIYVLIRLTIWSLTEAFRSLNRDISVFEGYEEGVED